ncbi:BTAD domain-containing putative transcriptional regulator [Spirillospora sp. CA-294931]|uniref:BTAD domain-containing putative transcriptional regulator n=1 Tax=Spirillospora sp. CA-294931 TaxID=3240042 RepID=UPI003D9346EC
MRFGVLGPLAVWTDDGEPVAVPGLKVRALLADLLVNEGRPVPADRLIDDLWGDAPPKGNPPGALSAKVSQLRRVLEDAEAGARGLVASRPAGYALQTDRVDARRFEALRSEARESAEPRVKAELLGEALGLWRGPVLADFADEEFARATITRLEELRLATIEDRAELRLALGEHVALAGELGDVLAVNPFRERLRAAHMRALYRAGRPSEALESFDRMRERLADELGLDPGPELVSLQRAILNQDPSLDAPAPRPRPRTNVKVPATELIGRDGAVDEIGARLESGRLVTLTGPGGVGKTRLALETAGRLNGTFGDGVWLVELAPLDRAAVALPDEVMRVLDIRDEPSGGEPLSPIDRLIGSLRPRRLLLVLDNCEHVVEQAADLVERLLTEVPGLRVLATSREPLGLPEEVVWAVPPLEVPPEDGEPGALAEAGAVRLFAARASAASRAFRLDDDSAAAVATLCRRLDGIPLALELAATRVRALGVHGLVERLDDRFRLLATGHRGAPQRQRTLTAMIDWSWELLSEPERAVLRRLSVHADGCTLEAAEAVCAGDDADDVLDLLVRLVDRSLVVMAEGPRYRLLESVAAYCDDRLNEAAERERVRAAHRRYYTELAERGERDLRGREQARGLRVLSAESANLRAALDGAIADRDAESALRLVNALAWFWQLRGRLTEAQRSLDAALALDAGPRDARAIATAWRAGVALGRGDELEWPARREAALAALDEVGDPVARARAQWFLVFAGVEVDDLDAGAALLGRAQETFAAEGDRWGQAASLVLRAHHAHARGDTALLRREAALAAKMFDELGDRWGRLQAAAWLANHAELTGDYDRAFHLQREGLRLAEELRLWPEAVVRVGWLAWISLQRAAYPQAREYAERLRAMAGDQRREPLGAMAELVLGLVDRREGDLDSAHVRLHALLDAMPPPEAAPPLFLPLILVGLGYVHELRGDADRALAFHRDALEVSVRHQWPRDIAFSLEGLAGALALAGRHAEAARTLGAAATARASHGLTAGPAEREDIDRVAAAVRAELDEDAYRSEYDGGTAESPGECLALRT